MRYLGLLSFVLLLVFVSNKAMSQEMNFGVKTGINLTNVATSSNEIQFDSRYSFHYGAFLRGRISNFALQPELIFFNIATDVIDESGAQSISYTERARYLSVPVLLKVYFIDFIHVHAGPQFNFLRNAGREFPPLFGVSNTIVDVTSFYNSTELGLAFGSGIDTRLGFSAEIRYSFGLTNMYSLADVPERNSKLLQVSIGWNFLK